MPDPWSARAYTRRGYTTYPRTPAGDPTSPHRPPARGDQVPPAPDHAAQVRDLARSLHMPLDPWQEQMIERLFTERVRRAGHFGWLPPVVVTRIDAHPSTIAALKKAAIPAPSPAPWLSGVIGTPMGIPVRVDDGLPEGGWKLVGADGTVLAQSHTSSVDVTRSGSAPATEQEPLVELVAPAGHGGPLPPLPESAYPPDATPLPLAPPVRRWWHHLFRAKEA